VRQRTEQDPPAASRAGAGRWHGDRRCFGLHYDLHAHARDTDLGARCAPRELIPLLRAMRPDFVQTDCKGHPGLTSWFSRVPDASVAPGVVRDALAQWRAATRRLGLPLHCHYSGIWDRAAGRKRPAWAAVGADGRPAGAPSTGPDGALPTGEKMCPRSGYLENLLIPQLIELIDRYGVDGFWIDGDLWAVEPCYCARCRTAFAAATGIAAPPEREGHPDWPAWWNFTRESFLAYVARYCDAVHARKPGVLVCSNWLQTFRDPGKPKTPTDWISGDNTWVWGLDGSRCEARFLSTRGKPWDIMLWSFYYSHGHGLADSPAVFKPEQMLEQEAAVLLSFGGNVQVYEHPPGLRDGRLVAWRQRRLGRVGRFVKARRAMCQHTATIPQIAVLHSETHLRSAPTGRNLMWGTDVGPVQGAVFSLLECHYGVDVLDEWALRPRLAEFPVVVVPEQDRLSDDVRDALRGYVEAGGRLLVTGARAFERFGPEFLGVGAGRVEEQRAYHVPAGDGAVPLYSPLWRLVEPAAAVPHGRLGLTPLPDDRLLDAPAFTINRVGRGCVAYVPADLFRDFNRNRYPLTRVFAGAVVRALAGRFDIEVDGPTCLDVTLRRRGGRRIVHLVNRASGIPNQPNNGAIDEIPAVGPVTVRLRLPARNYDVRLAFEKADLDVKAVRRGGVLSLSVRVPHVRIHGAVVVDERIRMRPLAPQGERI
jgi:hypothetical protein